MARDDKVSHDRCRRLGDYWEGQFEALALARGLATHNAQRARHEAAMFQASGAKTPWLMADVAILSVPHEYHEIKHKNATDKGMYGLEAYRLGSLLQLRDECGQGVVYYTIHDHDLAGGPQNKANDIAHWRTLLVGNLDGTWKDERMCASFINGERKPTLTYFWPACMWGPLHVAWDRRPPPRRVPRSTWSSTP